MQRIYVGIPGKLMIANHLGNRRVQAMRGIIRSDAQDDMKVVRSEAYV